MGEVFEVPSEFDDLIRIYHDNYCNFYDVLDTTSGNQRRFLLEIFLAQMDPELKQRTGPAIKFLLRISNPHILRMYDAYTSIANKLFISQEFALNRRLTDYLDYCYDINKRPPEDIVWKVASVVANTLTSSSLKTKTDPGDFVHGHLCPAALFITDSGRVKLGHFEYLRIIGKQSCMVPIENTSFYAAPESVRQKEFTSKSDAWSLGCILYELCMLKPAVNLSTDDDIEKYFLSEREYKIDTNIYSNDLAQIIQRLLTVSSEKRISISELILCKQVSAAFKQLQDNNFVIFSGYKYKSKDTPTRLSATSSPIPGVPTKVTISPKTTQKQQSAVLPTTTATFPIIGKQTVSAAATTKSIFVPPPPPPPLPPAVSFIPQLKTDYLAASSANKPAAPVSAPVTFVPAPAPTPTPAPAPTAPTAAQPSSAPNEVEQVKAPQQPKVPKYTELMQCIIDNRTADAIKYLNQTGRATEEGITALMLAAERGFTDLVKLLSSEIRKRVVPESGWDIKDRWYSGASALHFAAHANQRAVLEILIDVESDICTDHGYTALMVAAMANSLDCIPLLVDKLSCKTVEFGREKGKTALMLAAEYGHAQVCQLLLKLEGTMTLDYDKKTALMYAAENGHIGAVKVLKRREVRLTLNDNGIIPGGTATMLAVITSNEDVVSILAENESGLFTGRMESELNPYFSRDVYKLIRPFTGRSDATGTHIFNEKEGYKYKLLKNVYTLRTVSAMMIAAQLNLQGIVNKLHPREAGLKRPSDGISAYDIVSRVYIGQKVCDQVDPQVFDKTRPGLTVKDYHPMMQALKLELSITRDENLNTDLILAVEANDIETAKTRLSQAGLQNNRGKTALMAAAEKGHVSCASLVINREAKMQNSSGWTALMIAAMFGKEEVAKQLINLEIGMVTVDGWTALMGAAYSNSAQLVELLLKEEVGKTTNALYYDGPGWTALLLSAKRNNLDCVKLLIQHEMTMRLPPSEGHPKGRTVLDIAGSKTKDWVIAYVREHIAKK